VKARAIAVLVLLGARAYADPDLAVHHAPVRHLRMRTAQPAPPPPSSPDDDRALPAPLRARTERAADRGIAPTDSAAAVRFRVDLGFGVDGAQPSTTPGGVVLAQQTPYTASRGYGFGDVYLGTHGLVLPSVSTYIAAHAQYLDPAVAPPLSSPYDHAPNQQIRSGWAEADHVFTEPLLAPLTFKAGRLFIYGPAPAHLDGAAGGYETKILKIHFFGGLRVPDWIDGPNPPRATITGADLRLDLMAWKRFPAVLDASTFHWGDHNHLELGASVTRGRGLFLSGSARMIDGNLAHENATAHFRVSDVTRITAELDHRSSYDWRWDPDWVGTSAADDARRYLDLGQVGPRLLASVRAGTAYKDNLDLLVHGAGALDQQRSDIPDSTFAATWGEVGGAVEGRVRRTLSLALSSTFRTYRRLPQAPILTALFPEAEQAGGQPLPPSSAMGEQSFIEAGATVRYSTGARKLSAEAELYARRIRWHRIYEIAQSAPIDDLVLHDERAADIRGGGRFSLEAWITPRFRVRAEYELSTAIEIAPEILGFKSLKLLVEGTL
jgi:hypothetical protein